MKTWKLIIALLMFGFSFSACTPSDRIIQTAISETEVAKENSGTEIAQATSDAIATRKAEAQARVLTKTAEVANLPTKTRQPTNTPQPSFTPSPTNTPTTRPTRTNTPTPKIGEFDNPAPLGERLVYKRPPMMDKEMSCTVIEVIRGDDAKELAKSVMDWLDYKIVYEDAIDVQETLAVRVRLELLKAVGEDVEVIYPQWNLTLRYSQDGKDIWPAWPVISPGHEWDIKAYPPFEREGWIFFLIKENTNPYLYFQPDLIVTEQFGYRTEGGYFDLSEEPEPVISLIRKEISLDK